jgi:hypothetical protein
MGGKPHYLYRQVMSRWGVASRGRTREVKQLSLKGTGEAEASRQEARLG